MWLAQRYSGFSKDHHYFVGVVAFSAASYVNDFLDFHVPRFAFGTFDEPVSNDRLILLDGLHRRLGFFQVAQGRYSFCNRSRRLQARPQILSSSPKEVSGFFPVQF